MPEGQPMFHGGNCKQCDYLKKAMLELSAEFDKAKIELEALRIASEFWEGGFESED